MNAHIWELDGCEIENGRRMKEGMNALGVEILNCVWDGLSEATWFTDENNFSLGMCVWMELSGLKKAVSARVRDRSLLTKLKQ